MGPCCGEPWPAYRCTLRRLQQEMCSTQCILAPYMLKWPHATVPALAGCRHKRDSRDSIQRMGTGTLRHHWHDMLPWYILLLHPLRTHRVRSPWEPCGPQRRPFSCRAKACNTCAPDRLLCIKTPHPVSMCGIDLACRLASLLQLPMAFCDAPPGRGPWEGDSGRPEEPMGGRAPLE